MASLTDIIQQRVIQKKYEALPEWLRWFLFVPMTLICSFISFVLISILFGIIMSFIDKDFGPIAEIFFFIPIFYYTTYRVLECTAYFAPDHKEKMQLSFLTLIISSSVYTILIILEELLVSFGISSSNFDVRDKYISISHLIVMVTTIFIGFNIYKKAVSPRKRLVDIGTNLNREEDTKGSLLY